MRLQVRDTSLKIPGELVEAAALDANRSNS